MKFNRAVVVTSIWTAFMGLFFGLWMGNTYAGIFCFLASQYFIQLAEVISGE